MANEYLKRTPTSTGNRRVFTWSGWVKRNILGTDQNLLCSTEPGLISKLFFNTNDKLDYQNNSPSFELITSQTFRDTGNWTHVLFVAETTASISSERIRLYVNGVRIAKFDTETYPAINSTLIFNYPIGHFISNESSNVNYFTGEIADVFFIDGQALTPDVFGFYKVGKGYVSAGSTQSTDFRPGQWVPKTPRVIKTAINNNGGFGVNGFYLPMNDSNNFGADFHCDPNSIIKLQENLPQPRSRIDGVGDYTGALRDDPFKQYLVLALPFVSGGLNSGFGDYASSIKGSGSAKVGTLSNSPSIVNTAGYYGSALSINGTGSGASGSPVITFASNADFSFGSSPYTIECWLNPSTNTSHDAGVVVVGDSGAQTAISYTNGIIMFRGPSGSVEISSPTYSQVNQWFHTAIVRETGSNIKLYVNGVCVGVKTNFTSTLSQDKLNIGAWEETGIYGFNGQIQDLRIYKGVAKYTGGFDVPRPYTPVGIATWRAVPDTTANNFATLNPLTQLDNGSITYTNGNLTGYVATNTNSTTSTIGISSIGSQKYYAEFRATSSNYPRIGVIDATIAQQGISASGSGTASANNLNISGVISWGGTVNELYINSGTGVVNGGYTTNDIIGVAYDSATRNVWFSKNGTWQNFTGSGANPATGTNPVGAVNGSNSVYFGIRPEASNIDCNFGQNPTFSGNTTAGTYTDSNNKGLFKYQPPSGFLALCEDNLPTPAISDPGKHFKTVLWTGDGGSRNIVGVGFTPDLVWIKKRAGGTENHNLFDSVRGANIYLQSNTTGAEASAGIPMLTSFNNDGFSLGSNGGVNENNHTFAAWCWKAGAGTTSTNTNGSITSVVSVNQDAGFSIVSGLSGGSSGSVFDSFGHGLGKTPSFILVKNRDIVDYFYAYHKSLPTQYLVLGATNASAGAGGNNWGTSGPSSSVITTKQSSFAGAAGQRFIFYCWAEIEGFSKFGSYTGNGSADGPFVYCGFRPAWVMIKNISGSHNWEIYDSSMNPINPVGLTLLPNASDAQIDTTPRLDFLSNGFKWRNIGGSVNGSGNTIIFAAYAESPFQTANAK